MEKIRFKPYIAGLFYSVVLLLAMPGFAHDKGDDGPAADTECELQLLSEQAGVEIEFHGRFFSDLQRVFKMSESLKEAPAEFAAALNEKLSGVPLDLKGENQFIVVLPLEVEGRVYNILARTKDFGKTFHVTDVRDPAPDQKIRVRTPVNSELLGDLNLTGWMKSEIPDAISDIPFEKNSYPLYITILSRPGYPNLYVSYKDITEKDRKTREVRDMRQSRDFLIEHSIAQKLLRKHAVKVAQLEEVMGNWDGLAVRQPRSTSRPSLSFVSELDGRLMIVHFTMRGRNRRPWILSAWFLDQYPRRMQRDLDFWNSAEKIVVER